MTCTAQTAVIGMRDGLMLGWLPSPDRHLERVDNELTADVIRDRPAHDASAERVEHDGAIELAGIGAMFGDVHDPQTVGTVGVELTADEIVVRHRVGITFRAAVPASPIDPLHAGLAHQSFDPLA